MGTWFNGQQDAYWVAWLEFGRQIGMQYESHAGKGLDYWIDICKSCHWFYPFLDFCIISDKPREIHRDELGRLHNPSGMALKYLDWGFYSIHGVRLDGEIVEHPENITVAQIDSEPNVEIRRIMVERYDKQRFNGAFLVDGGAQEIHRDECGILYRREVGDDEPIIMVKVVNTTPEPSGEFRDYFLRVPPTIQTARAAVAWTFEQSPEAYQPEVQS
jgi:hypothetical protein